MVSQGKKVFITAALPYANGPLHLGHIRSTYLPADIYARYRRLKGDDALYVCATDEHGTPIVLAAEKAGMSPEEFVNIYHERDKLEFQKLGFSMDIFHRTSSHENKEMTIHFYETLKKNGYIYRKKVEQNYCEKCKRFLPDRFVIGKCPKCGAENQYSDYCEVCGATYKSDQVISPKCISCGTAPVRRESEHAFFRLSAFSDQLKSYLKTNPNLQPEVTNYVLNWIEEGLIDWDITRDLNWGIQIPDDPQKVFYVWFDAPIGYLGSLKALKKEEWKEYVDSEMVHFIGKDIIYHHFLFWPAMLIGAGIKVPDMIAVRGYLNLEGSKFSKSKNWFVSLSDYLEEFDPDYLRYYMTTITPHDLTDADFQWKDFQAKVNNELISNFGNAVNRILSIIKKDFHSTVPEPNTFTEKDKLLLGKISHVKIRYINLMDDFEFKQALELTMAFSTELNVYLSDRAPWKAPTNEKQTILYCGLRGITALGTMLYPIIPFACERLFMMLKVDPKSISVDQIDKELVTPGKKIGEVVPLFVKIDDKKIEKQLKNLMK